MQNCDIFFDFGNITDDKLNIFICSHTWVWKTPLYEIFEDNYNWLCMHEVLSVSIYEHFEELCHLVYIINVSLFFFWILFLYWFFHVRFHMYTWYSNRTYGTFYFRCARESILFQHLLVLWIGCQSYENFKTWFIWYEIYCLVLIHCWYSSYVL